MLPTSTKQVTDKNESSTRISKRHHSRNNSFGSTSTPELMNGGGGVLCGANLVVGHCDEDAIISRGNNSCNNLLALDVADVQSQQRGGGDNNSLMMQGGGERWR